MAERAGPPRPCGRRRSRTTPGRASSSSGSASATPATTPGAGSGWPRWTRNQIARLFAEAEAAAADYAVERIVPPVPDTTLQQMVEVTAAINDAPMGSLTFEDEVFDLGRLQDIETARERKGMPQLPGGRAAPGDR